MKTKSRGAGRGPNRPQDRTDQEWLRENSPQITRKYAQQWIAVYRQSVIASGRNPELVHQNARMIAGKEPFMMKHIEKGIVIL